MLSRFSKFYEGLSFKRTPLDPLTKWINLKSRKFHSSRLIGEKVTNLWHDCPSFHTLPTSKWWILQAGAKSPRECFICKLYPPSRLSIIYWNLLTASNFVLQKAFFIDIAKWMVCVCKCGLGEFVLQKLLFMAINLSSFLCVIHLKCLIENVSILTVIKRRVLMLNRAFNFHLLTYILQYQILGYFTYKRIF